MDNANDSTSDLSDMDTDTAETGIMYYNLYQSRTLNDELPTTSSSSDSDTHQDEEYPALDESTRSLPCEHRYLGELEPVRGRVIIDDDSIQKIPVICLAWSFVLVPGQTFPLVIQDSSTINILKYAVEHDHIFSVISANLWYANGVPVNLAVAADDLAKFNLAQGEPGAKRFRAIRKKFNLVPSKKRFNLASCERKFNSVVVFNLARNKGE